ncbi:hypothetical protein EPJ70_11270 [Brachyspira aalborgi]|uniref:Uncharacterized protein n=1 Tax=Brachyspira aalborgi TaxID=29522 RepID=A0A5C8F1U2_9SPIR|nr:hypothetical protein [Brachyspira aalborgi]TXJ43334.1 hypothetical protein EPJ70_11270 [Brachyspira aalborgi]
MATKKTNNEEISKKNSASKKSAEISKTSKKQTASLKKKTDGQIKKTTAKKTATKKSVEVPKKTVSSSIRKIEPIKTDDIEKKEERESIKLLREAIKAKSKNISKPVSVKKHLIIKDEEIKENEIVSNTTESSIINKENAKNIEKADYIFNEFKKKEETKEIKTENKTFSKNTYSKSDIFKKPVIIRSPIEVEELKRNIESSKFNQSEMDEAIENAAMIEEDTPIEDYSIYSSKKLEELRKKDIKIIETEEEMKASGIPEVERKPAQPYTAPAHSSEKKQKKSNKLIAIIGIIIIILGLSYLGFQFFGNKTDASEDDFYSSISTNENETNNIISSTTNTNENISQTNETKNITNEISKTNDIKAVSSNNTVIQSNIATSPKPNLPNTPNIPNPPIIPNPPAKNTNAYFGGNTYRTKWTDTLTSIASSELGDARRWPTIYVMNENIFKDPDSLVFNKDIRIPEGAKKKVDEMNSEERMALYNDYMRVAEIYLSIGKTNSANTIKSRANSIIK